LFNQERKKEKGREREKKGKEGQGRKQAIGLTDFHVNKKGSKLVCFIE
jgi:hypothetical protein